ncbi:MAG: hypothetical protein U9Q92_07155 [archaeon]|nr:hypothetical protein [archaeon]
MTETALEQKIVHELQAIRHDIEYIKKHIADVDTVLTDNDMEALREADKDLLAGKTKRL